MSNLELQQKANTARGPTKPTSNPHILHQPRLQRPNAPINEIPAAFRITQVQPPARRTLPHATPVIRKVPWRDRRIRRPVLNVIRPVLSKRRLRIIFAHERRHLDKPRLIERKRLRLPSIQRRLRAGARRRTILFSALGKCDESRRVHIGCHEVLPVSGLIRCRRRERPLYINSRNHAAPLARTSPLHHPLTMRHHP